MKYFESKTYGKFCKLAFGSDHKQIGMVTDEEFTLFLRKAEVPRGGKALDLGCGAGFVANRVASALGVHVTGISISADEVRFAQDTFKDDAMLTFLEMDFDALDFPDETKFDLIYSFDTLYFSQSIETLHALLGACERMLNPGGKIAVFWMNTPETYPMESVGAEYTQIGIWAKNANVQYQSFDLTEKHRQFWMNGQRLLLELEPDFRAEGYDDFEVIEEYANFSDMCAADDKVCRWLYVFSKPKAK